MNKKRYPYTQDRELSWLKFNQRVLEEAADSNTQLLERLKFLAIFTSNLDEFYRVRVGSIMDKMLIDDTKIDPTSGMRPSEQLNSIFKETKKLYIQKDLTAKTLYKDLKTVQISELSYKNLNKKQQKTVNKYFEHELRPLLAPQIIDFHHPFPFLINKELYIFFEITENGKSRYGLLPLPSFLPKVLYLNEEKTSFIPIDSILLHEVDKLFHRGKITFKTIIRVTRNADINLNASNIDEDEDYRKFVEKILKRRDRLSATRLEIFKDYNLDAIEYLCKRLNLKQEQVFISHGAPLDMNYIFEIIDHLPADLKSSLSYPNFVPYTNDRLNPNKPIIPQILDHDVLLSFPYQDVGEFIRLLKEASNSKEVLSIKITIYRLAKNSQVVRWLCQAAENGKEVTVLMELRARFDEEHNIRAAERLELAGCNIIYGFDEYKVHSKLCLITLQTRSGLKTITQIGTGNYNEKTSHQYTDFSLITANKEIGQDATEFFKNMNISNLEGQYQKLIVSPNSLKQSILDYLDLQIAQAKEGGLVQAWFKMNSLTDTEVIQKLSEASQAGVKIRLLVRGICCLVPGIEGHTQNIEVRQIVGRYLEHSRLYIFFFPKQSFVYLSSADFMTRNTERRVEVGVPVEDLNLKDRLIQYFQSQWNDDKKGRSLLSTKEYTHIIGVHDEPFSSQEFFMKQAKELQFISKNKPSFFQTLKSFFKK